jgi:cyclopropane fatty-acyl-phospholipid synthase-like methyltransferase
MSSNSSSKPQPAGGAADVVEQARDYYDSGDADNFYLHVWGGEDIHIGLYEEPDDAIVDASRRTVEHMAQRLTRLEPGARVLDIGAGYGGAARYLARERGLHVTCLNLSEVQNKRNRQFTSEQGLSSQIEVVDGSFEELPFDPGSFDAVWSQDSILHSGRRELVFAEVDRVLKPGGDFVFTDPMQAENVDEAILAPVLARIHLSSMGSFSTYRRYAAALGWVERDSEDLSYQLPRHYSRVKTVLETRESELSEVCTAEYRERMKLGLDRWVKAGETGALAWGIMHFAKSA